MAYNLTLTKRIRDHLDNTPNLEEKKMFGGVAFLLHGHMVCGVHGQSLIVRVGPDNYQEALSQPFTHPFDLTGKPMSGWVTVGAEGYDRDDGLHAWLKKGIDFVLSLPAK